MTACDSDDGGGSAVDNGDLVDPEPPGSNDFDPDQEAGEPMPVEPDNGIGDGAEPLETVIIQNSEAVAQEILGKNQAEAEAIIQAEQIPFRYTQIDGEHLGVTADYIVGRLNLKRNQGVITTVEVEGGARFIQGN